jgi:hypothetical protein
LLRRLSLVVFLIATSASGFLYWRWADWWAYVQDPIRGPWPKFVMPWWWQVGESLVVGSAVGALAAGLALCLVKLRRPTSR